MVQISDIALQIQALSVEFIGSIAENQEVWLKGLEESALRFWASAQQTADPGSIDPQSLIDDPLFLED